MCACACVCSCVRVPCVSSTSAPPQSVNSTSQGRQKRASKSSYPLLPPLKKKCRLLLEVKRHCERSCRLSPVEAISIGSRRKARKTEAQASSKARNKCNHKKLRAHTRTRARPQAKPKTISASQTRSLNFNNFSQNSIINQTQASLFTSSKQSSY